MNKLVDGSMDDVNAIINENKAFTVSPNYKGKHPKTPEELEEMYKRRAEQNPNVVKHRTICKELNALYAKKNHDYGDSFSDTYKKLGIVACITRLSDKFNRIVSLSTGGKQIVNDESLLDTLNDLANYAIMTRMCIEGDKQ